MGFMVDLFVRGLGKSKVSEWSTVSFGRILVRHESRMKTSVLFLSCFFFFFAARVSAAWETDSSQVGPRFYIYKFEMKAPRPGFNIPNCECWQSQVKSSS